MFDQFKEMALGRFPRDENRPRLATLLNQRRSVKCQFSLLNFFSVTLPALCFEEWLNIRLERNGL